MPAARADLTRLEIAGANPAISGLQGFELFDESDMGLSDFAQRIKYQRAIQGELARTIMMMAGVAEARVHVSIPERTLYRREQQQTEAAVTILTRTPSQATPALVEAIQRLVGASVPELSASNVVVLNALGEVMSSGALASEAERGQFVGGIAESDPIVLLAIDAVARALPERRFDLAIDRAIIDPPESSLHGEATVGFDPTTTSASQPQAPLLFALITETALSAEEKSRTRAELGRTGLIGSDSGHLSFQIGPLSAHRAHGEPVNARLWPDAFEAPSAWNEQARRNPSPRPSWLTLLAMVLATMAAFAVWHWRRAKPLLSLAERKAFAERLREGLQTPGRMP